jgi:hypothetical protein
MPATKLKIKDAQENSAQWIEYLATKSEENLIRRLRINHLQYEIAAKEKKDDVCELERIIIEARIFKAENNIPDLPNEIELAIADIETTVAKAEERKEILEDLSQSEKISKPEIREDNSNQTSLF